MTETRPDTSSAASPSKNKDTCFHCGLPNGDAVKTVPSLLIMDQERYFCCYGCRSISETIIDAGLEDYYLTRDKQQSGERARQTLPEELAIFDREDIQQDFVSNQSGTKDAVLLLEGIRCPACIWLNEKHIRSLEGVVSVSIDDLTSRAHIKWQADKILLSEILRAIEDIGYRAYPFDAEKSRKLLEARQRRSWERVLFAGLAGMMVMKFAIVTYILVPDTTSPPLPLWVLLGRWSSMIVTGIILVYSAQDFFVGAWKDLRAGRMGMDVPISLGLSIAYMGSIFSTYRGYGEVYYDSIAMFVTFVLLARRWELTSRFQAAKSLDKLASIQPKMATLVDPESRQENRVSVNELKKGHTVKLVPGETVPVDIELLENSGSFDEAILTGENMPVLHKRGDKVLAGAINLDQPVSGRVVETIQFSTLTRMQELVHQGMSEKPAQQLLTQWVASWFVPAILLLAFLTATAWYFFDPAQALSNTIAILIITCPCALSLATPAALSVAGAKLVENHVLPLNMARFESLALADTAVFDKTGTLTIGKPVLRSEYFIDEIDKEFLQQISVTLARHSEHPLSRALTQCYDHALIPVDPPRNEPGKGIESVYKGDTWRLGSQSFSLSQEPADKPNNRPENNIENGEESAPDKTRKFTTFINTTNEMGASLVRLSKNAQPVAVFAFLDSPKAGIHQTLKHLKKSGIQSFHLLSGDIPKSVENFARNKGFDVAKGSLQPSQKLQYVRKLQNEGKRVLMVGDGINDAPTLAAADISLSFSESTDMANINSDFMLSGQDVALIYRARKIAQTSYNNIRLSLAWALGYNVIAIPFAALGWIPPWGAAIGMSASSLIVVLNALRLRKI